MEYFSYPDRYNAQASVSYVRGSHNLKFGFQDSWGPYNQAAYANADLYQNYLNGAPATVTLRATPIRWQDRLNANLGIYAQDAWTIKRVTINYGLRWDYVSEQVTGQPAQSGRFARVPAYDTFKLPIWRNWSPRVSLVYDLFGNTKTAVRAGFNRFPAAATTTFAALYDPGNGINITSTAAWTDLNKDDIAQGELGCVYLTPGCEINFANVTQGGTGAPNLTAVNGQGTIFTVTPTTRYTVCPGSSAAGCVVGALVVPNMNQASMNVPLIAPATELTPRITQLDFSLAKKIALERITFSPKIDVFNAFNSSAYYTVRSLTYSTAPGATYKLPGSILQGRILRLAVVVNF